MLASQEFLCGVALCNSVLSVVGLKALANGWQLKTSP